MLNKRVRDTGSEAEVAEVQNIWNQFAEVLTAFWQIFALRETGRALACYYGKYLAKGFADRPGDWKHVRLVRYPGARAHVPGGPKLNPKWKIATALRSSAGPRGWLWRQRLRKLAVIFGVTEEQGGIATILGTRWGYHHRETINRICLTQYPTGIHAQADGHDFWDHPNAPAPGDVIDVQITDFNGIREGYLSPIQTAWQCAEKASRWNPSARRFVERFGVAR